MAKCDEGYLCEVCGEEVDGIAESDLYLRYVIGLVPPEDLHLTAERHIRCNPALAQFIVHDDFEPVELTDEFSALDKSMLDSAFVQERERLVTRGYDRLLELRKHRPSLLEYPLPEVRERLQ